MKDTAYRFLNHKTFVWMKISDLTALFLYYARQENKFCEAHLDTAMYFSIFSEVQRSSTKEIYSQYHYEIGYNKVVSILLRLVPHLHGEGVVSCNKSIQQQKTPKIDCLHSTTRLIRLKRFLLLFVSLHNLELKPLLDRPID
jgi:hypothetical protein